jgi:hypothetical protein
MVFHIDFDAVANHTEFSGLVNISLVYLGGLNPAAVYNITL